MLTKIKQTFKIFRKEVKPKQTKVIIVIPDEYIEMILELACDGKTPIGRYRLWQCIKDNILKTDYDDNIEYSANFDMALNPRIIYYRKEDDS